jgi:hypothetical protein
MIRRMWHPGDPDPADVHEGATADWSPKQDMPAERRIGAHRGDLEDLAEQTRKDLDGVQARLHIALDQVTRDARRRLDVVVARAMAKLHVGRVDLTKGSVSPIKEADQDA